MTRPRSRSAWIVRLAVLFAFAAPAGAQSVTSGMLEGTVRSADGRLLTQASLLLTDASAGSTRVLEVAPDGRFGVAYLPSGSYDLRVERLGFAPRLVQGIPVRPGQRVDLRVVLTPSDAAVMRVDTIRFASGGRTGSKAGEGRWFTPFDVAGLPTERYGIDELARVTSVAGPGLEVEGLPSRMTGVVIDGVPFTPARRPGLAEDPAGAVAFPLQVLAQAELVTHGPDVEWGGSGGGYLSGHTRRGTRDFRVAGFGSWGAGSLDGAAPFAPGSVSHGSMQGGVLISGPIVGDTAGFVLGLEARRFETPLQYGLAFAPATDSLARVAQDAYGVALGGADGRLLTTEVLSGFGRLDWQLSDANALTVRGNLAATRAPVDGVGAWLGRVGGGSEGLDVSAAATLASRLGSSLGQEARVGVEVSRREPAGSGALPATSLAAEGVLLGIGDGRDGRFERTTLHASETLQYRAGAHRLKLGASVRASRYEGRYLPFGAGEFFFSTLGAFEGGEGYFVQSSGPRPAASFGIPRYSAFLQDTWTLTPGLELLLGLRADVDALPKGKVALNQEWASRTWLDNRRLGETRALLGPRLGFEWNQGEERRWTVRGAAGIYYDEADPAVIGEVLANTGTLQVRRGAGTIDAWPGFPQNAGVETGSTLTLLAPDYEAPRSTRGSFGVSRALGAGTSLHLALAYRRTEFLPRRADLNLVPGVAAGSDAHGRDVFGTLVKQGALVFAEPGTNRRFPGFDQVFALNTDGWSEYRGATVSFEHRPESRLTAFGSYTYSATRDNWLGARSGWADAQLAPFPGAEGDDWTEGRSDFDVPHRAALGGELALGGRIAPRLAAVYRFRSGYPFTPGFRPGVDANGDGSARNDPAFVDPAVPGYAEVASSWTCLRGQEGGFAERNACRESGVHSLDARIAFDFLRSGRRSAALVIDALGLLTSTVGETDRALYLVDPAGALETVEGRTALPLVANPSFGDPIVRYATGRTIRIGFQVDY